MQNKGTGIVALLDRDMSIVSDTQPCEVALERGSGSWFFQFLTNHTLASKGNARFIGVFYGDEDSSEIWFVVPIVGSGMAGQTIHCGPSF